MFEERLNNILGLELITLGDNLYACQACLLSKHGKILEVQTKIKVKGSLAQVLEKIPRKHPVALNLTGKGILYKNVPGREESGLNEIFAAGFPGVNRSDFYTQKLASGEGNLLHIVRQNTVDSILETLKSSGIKILALTLGASVISSISVLFRADTSVLSFHGHKFQMDAKQNIISYEFDGIQDSETSIKLVSEDLPAAFLIAYAAAFQLLLHKQIFRVSADVKPVDNAFEQFLQQEMLTKKLFVFSGFLFAALLTSFLLFEHFNSENANLSGKVGTIAASQSQIELFRQNTASNEILLKKVNWNGGYSPGFVLKEIGLTCPRQLSLSKVVMNPDSKKEESEYSIVQLWGLCGDLTAVNNWIFLLKEKAWVRSVKLQGYSEDTESGHYKFNLKIGY